MRYIGVTFGHYPEGLWLWLPRLLRYAGHWDVVWGRVALTVAWGRDA